MRRLGFQFCLSVSIAAAVAFLFFAVTVEVKAQDAPTECLDQGTWYPISSCHCSGTCGSSRSSGVNSGPSAADIAAQREREAEQARLAEAQRRLAEQQRLDADRRQREHDEWQHSLNEAVGSLKGVSTDDMGLKGVGGNTNFFGLKGVSPDEAGSMIKTGEPEGTPHSVTGAWQQLHCAAEFAGDAVADLKKIETGEADARELDEIHFVAGQASAVMHGGQVTVECSPAPPIDLSHHPDPANETPVIDGILKRTVHDAETYVAAQQRADALRQKLDDLKAQRAAPGAQQPAAAAKTAPASSAQSGQTFSQSADQQKIDAAIQQGNAYQKSHADYYALLLATQRALNEANSQKITSQADADKVGKQNQAILSGQFTAASTSTQSQAQKKQPGDEQ